VTDKHQLGDAPIEAAYREQMNAVARGLDEIFNGDAKGPARKVGFVLMVFEYGNHDGRCNYISNGADRRDIVTLMKEMIARFEGQPEMRGKA
jgi:predicted component of type VI protein secretion system